MRLAYILQYNMDFEDMLARAQLEQVYTFVVCIGVMIPGILCQAGQGMHGMHA